jgi:hypothetical protein
MGYDLVETDFYVIRSFIALFRTPHDWKPSTDQIIQLPSINSIYLDIKFKISSTHKFRRWCLPTKIAYASCTYISHIYSMLWCITLIITVNVKHLNNNIQMKLHLKHFLPRYTPGHWVPFPLPLTTLKGWR